MKFNAAQAAQPGQAPSNPQAEQLLAQLKDIHEPAAVGWWPPAPGWWIAAGLLLALMIAAAVGIYLYRQKRQRLMYRTEGIRLLRAVSFEQPLAVSEINTLLKRIAVVSFGRRACAQLTGQRWIVFLQQTSAAEMPADAQNTLLEQLYRKSPPTESGFAALKSFAITWAAKHDRELLQNPARSEPNLAEAGSV
jgi:Domain of unknown function (DUF4381)